MILFGLLLIPYYEWIFRISTSGDMGFVPLMLTAFFAMGTGLLLSILSRSFRAGKFNRAITCAGLLILALLYMIEFFVYRSFKVFYDTDTVINGAGGVVGGFMGDVGRLVFTFDGLSRIALFLLPLPLYLILSSKKDRTEKIPLKEGIYRAAMSALFFCSAFLILKLSPAQALIYGPEYSFQSAVETFGLSTAFRLDLRKMFFGEELSFETGDAEMDREVSLSAESVERLLPEFPADKAETGGPSAKDPLDRYFPSPDKEGGGKSVPLMEESDGSSRNLLMDYEEFLKQTDSGEEEEKKAPIRPASDTAGVDEEFDEIMNIFSDRVSKEPESSGNENESSDHAGSDEAASEDETEEVLNEPESYEEQILPIDFDTLSQNATKGQKDLDDYVRSQIPYHKNRYTGRFKGKNLIFITAEAFSGSIIDPELTPTLYRLSTKGIVIDDYYQPAVAGTTGGEYENLFGLIPVNGGKSMKELTKQDHLLTIASALCGKGYYGKAFHNNTASVYGRNETHNRLGFSDGFLGMGEGLEEYVSYAGFPESDLEMLENTFPLYCERQPFCVYFMTVSGHGQYGTKINRMSAKNYDRVRDLPYSEIVKCYISNNLELEDGLAALIGLLEEKGIADDTVIVLGADHFPYGLDNDAPLGHMPYLTELYGSEVTNYLERDRNRLILWCGELEKEEPVVIGSPVSSLDILPTLLNLFGVDYDSRLLPGRDIFSDAEALVFNGSYDWKTDLGTYIASGNRFTPASADAVIPEGYVEETKKKVRNRMNYCKAVLSSNYFDHIFSVAY
ncbi:MAG: LTA synthase family protein [Lachnospiraceae bacterium]|nr:LTA synthase family protein [Lachnospiraceae bacterium]